ncbi:MAG: hypothetical protein ACI8SZ_000690, partial [Colwellia sp.]
LAMKYYQKKKIMFKKIIIESGIFTIE